MCAREFFRCWGQVGYKGKMTILSMGDGCEYKYVMTHELGHVIGFYHEHQRSDRDEFVEILWDNIVNCKKNLSITSAFSKLIFPEVQ